MKLLTTLGFIIAASLSSSTLAYDDEKTKVMTQGVNHLGLTVSNLNASVSFFTGVLGWKHVGGYDDYPSKFVTDGKIFLTLWQTQNGNQFTPFNRKNNVGLHHLALSVGSKADLNELYERFKQDKNITIEFAPELNGSGPTIHMMIREPSGNRIEFAYKPK